MTQRGRNCRRPDSLDHRADRATRGGDQGAQRGQEGGLRRGQGRRLRRQGAEGDPEAAQARPRRARRAGIAARPLHARDDRRRAGKGSRLTYARRIRAGSPVARGAAKQTFYRARSPVRRAPRRRRRRFAWSADANGGADPRRRKSRNASVTIYKFCHLNQPISRRRVPRDRANVIHNQLICIYFRA